MALGKRLPNRKRDDLRENRCRFQWAREEAKTAEGFVDTGPSPYYRRYHWPSRNPHSGQQ
jgi:hypothetical protein